MPVTITNMKVYTDGGCTNNQYAQDKRRMRIVVTDESGTVLVEKTLKGGSNNVAELWAVAEAMLFAKEGGVTELEIHTDSRNNLAWLDGKVGESLNDKAAVMNLIEAINELRLHLKMTVIWIPRQQNYAGVYIERNAGVGSVVENHRTPK
jgi:ribonuclease HI